MAKHTDPTRMSLALESAMRHRRGWNQIENRPPRHRVDWLVVIRPQLVAVGGGRWYRTGDWGATIAGASRWVHA